MRVVVMGGTSGIGRATALQQTNLGAEVIVTGRDPERLDAIKPHVAAAEQVDGTVPADVATFLVRLGEIDHLVLAFSPGPAGLGPIKEVTTDQLRLAFDGKLFPYLHAIQHAQVTGSITMISAVSARAALPGTTALAAVNGAIERIVSPLATELAPVRVNAVSPGFVDTAWWSFLDEDQRTAQFETAAQSIPAGRVGTADDVASAISYLISAPYVSGKVLPVDGGASVA